MSKELIINEQRCKSCGFCVKACPKDALSFGSRLNSGGYKYVNVDVEKCIACGMCYTVCPDYVFSIVEKESE